MSSSIELTDPQWELIKDRFEPPNRRGRRDPSMRMVNAQTVKGGRNGPGFHEAGGRGGTHHPREADRPHRHHGFAVRRPGPLGSPS